MKHLLVLLLAVLSAVGLFAESGEHFGIGVGGVSMVLAIGEKAPPGFGGVLTAGLSRIPLRFRLSGIAIGEVFFASLAADYLFNQSRSESAFGWYFGAGVVGHVMIHPDDLDMAPWIGVRLPLGIRIRTLKSGRLEVYGEVAPEWVPLIFDADESSFEFVLQAIIIEPLLGVRYWF
jgi:hypothetical protein